jgi:hypothetical protein
MDEFDLTPEDLDFHGVTSRYADVPGVSIDVEKIPERFRGLIEFAKYWSVGDDAERADLMWLTPYCELKAFAAAVWPLIPEINAWCAQHRDDVQVADEVILFDIMQEAAAEAVACHVDLDE